MTRHEREELFTETEELWTELVAKFSHLVDLAIARLESSGTPTTVLSLTTKEGLMANYPLNTGDSVIVTVTDTDTVTGLAASIDAGSLKAVLSSTTDTVVENADGTLTVTAGATLGTGNTLTVEATVNGVASKSAVGTYDVVAAVAPVNPTALSLSFGTETAPAAATPPPLVTTTNAPVTAGAVAGSINPATGLAFP